MDNGSCDGSAEWLQNKDGVHLIRNEINHGAPRARNQAIRWLMEQDEGPEWFLFLDNDVFVTEGWAHRALYHGEVDPSVGSVALCASRASKKQVVPYDGPDDQSSLDAFAHRHASDTGRRGVDATLFTSFAVLVRSEVIDQIGGFDEAFSPWGFEDDDISLRIRLAGWRNRVAMDTYVHHAHYGTREKSEWHDRWMAANWNAFVDKWCPSASGAALFDYASIHVPQLGEATESQLVFPVPAANAALPVWEGSEQSRRAFVEEPDGTATASCPQRLRRRPTRSRPRSGPPIGLRSPRPWTTRERRSSCSARPRRCATTADSSAARPTMSSEVCSCSTTTSSPGPR